jgi:uncharacterized membrane protein YukC
MDGVLPPYAITPCQQFLEKVKCILLVAVVEAGNKAFESLDYRQVIGALLLLNV